MKIKFKVNVNGVVFDIVVRHVNKERKHSQVIWMLDNKFYQTNVVVFEADLFKIKARIQQQVGDQIKDSNNTVTTKE